MHVDSGKSAQREAPVSLVSQTEAYVTDLG